MDLKYTDEETFEGIDFTHEGLTKGEYEFCTFSNCNLSGMDLADCKFLECEFFDCNLSNAILNRTSIQDTSFSGCKMLGLSFDECNDFSFSARFDRCQLNHSTFFQMKLMRCSFMECELEEVDFTQTVLTKCKLQNCNLLNATFDETNLEMADLRKSTNYSIDPESNRIKGARFSMPAVKGLLNKYQIVIEP